MSSLTEIKIGERVLYEDGRVGKLVDMKLTPNGINGRSLVVIKYSDIFNCLPHKVCKLCWMS